MARGARAPGVEGDARLPRNGGEEVTRLIDKSTKVSKKGLDLEQALCQTAQSAARVGEKTQNFGSSERAIAAEMPSLFRLVEKLDPSMDASQLNCLVELVTPSLTDHTVGKIDFLAAAPLAE